MRSFQEVVLNQELVQGGRLDKRKVNNGTERGKITFHYVCINYGGCLLIV